jgi:alkanesulfonate monooxygenase SsuD/methylene tetrahydromethanopterin reductase-like flavin-dependent oxidoreductase (luciferase family)
MPRLGGTVSPLKGRLTRGQAHFQPQGWAMKIEFGAIDHIDRQDRPIAETYDSRLKLLQMYDRAGFTTFHLTEHHSTPLGLAPSPLIFYSAAARITERIRFAPLVLIATLYHPLRLASEICMIDHLTKGRFEIGTGRGVSGVELGFFGVREADAPAMYGEAMQVVMQALTRDVVDFHGKFFDFTNVPIELRPYQLPHPPIWYATTSTEGAARAARDNMSIVTLVGTDFAAKIIASYKQAWNETHGASGKKMPRVGLTRFVYLSEDEQRAKQRGSQASHEFHESLVYLWKKYNATAASLDEVKRAAESTLLTGKPESLRARIEKEIKETGANYYVPRFAFGNLTHEESVRSLGLFTSEVMPHFEK